MNSELWSAFRYFSRLDTWKSDLSDVDFHLKRTRFYHSTGFALKNKIEVFAGRDLSDAHQVIVHELAHVDVGRSKRRWEHHHSDTWREQYACAVAEITGFLVRPKGRFVADLDYQVAAAMQARLRKRA